MKNTTKILGGAAILGLGGLSLWLYTKYKEEKKYADLYYEGLVDTSGGSGTAGLGLLNVQRDVRGTGLINVNRTRRGMGSLQMPSNDGLSNYMRMGLLQVSQRYRPRNGVEL